MQFLNMRGTTIAVAMTAITTMVISSVFLQKKQLYPSVVYMTKSNPIMAILYFQGFILIILAVKLLRRLFFGQLRAAELEHLIERSWYAVTETCLAFTVFRDDFSPKFVFFFTLLLVIKSFHGLTEDRVDYIERSPVISTLFHIRVISSLLLLGLLNCFFVKHAYLSTLMKGASVQLVFGFEYAILFTILVNILIKYILHTIDLQSETPWENKAVYLLYTELAIGLMKALLYAVFLVIMLKIYTFPLFIIRPMYWSLRSLKKSLQDLIMSRRAIRNMNLLYPDATAEELANSDYVCIICREEMSNSTSKKLPCNHIFHTSCLRSWFQRQQTCPTCRMNVLRNVPSPPSTNAQPQPQPAQPQVQNQLPVGGLLFGGMQAQMPNWPQGMQQAPVRSQATASATTTTTTTASSASSIVTSSTSTATTSSTQQPSAAPINISAPSLPPFLPPPFLPIMFPPPPMPPVNFSGLSDEEIHQMEGSERQNVEARIQSLRNIQILLDAAVLQMQQYSALVSSMRVNQQASSSSSHDNVTSDSSFQTATNSSSGASATKSTNSTGARPKVFYPAPKPFTTNMSSAPSPSSVLSSSSTSATSDSEKNKVHSSSDDNDSKINESILSDNNSEHDEIRRRRLEKFGSQNASRQPDNLDLD